MEQTAISAPDRTNWTIIATLALSMLLAALGTSIANIALPTLAAAFAAPFPLVQGVVVAYLAALTVSTIIAGRLGDRHGLKRMHLAGLSLFAVSSLLCGLAPNLWLLIGARVAQGIGAAFLMTLSMALMRETANSERIGRAMGLLGTVSALGTALGPSLGGVLITLAGWRGIFLVQVPLALLALALAWASLPRSAVKGHAPSAGFRALLAGNMAPNLAVNLLVAAVMMTTLVVGPFYLNLGLSLQAQMVGLVMSVGPVVSILGGVPAGRAVDAWGTQRILAIGLGLLAAGALLLAVLPGLIGVVGYVMAIIALTPGYQLFQAANNTAALAGTPKERRGLASGLLGLSRNLGLILGASAMGAVFAFGVGGGDFAQASSTAIARGMQLTFLLAAGMMLSAIGIAFGGSIARVLWSGYQLRS